MARRVLTDDGTVVGWVADLEDKTQICATEAEALALENAGQYKVVVDAFVNSREWARGQATRAQTLIPEFLAWYDTPAAQEQIKAESEKVSASQVAPNAVQEPAAEAVTQPTSQAAPQVPQMPEAPPMPA